MGYDGPTVNVIGFDDGPFAREHRGRVLLVGTVCSRTRLDGVVSGRILCDGTDSTRRIIELVERSQFGANVQAILLQGIAVGGFNVVDIHGHSSTLEVGVLVVTRKQPDMAAVERALFSDDPPGRPRVPGASRKWRLIQAAGELDLLGPSRRALRRPAATGQLAPGQRLWIQRAGLSLEQARDIVFATTLHGNVSEPLRFAHLIAGGIVTGKSRGRA
ncbi:MAG: DUF99 family protein [Polyangiaceae bacterium]|nr:DUF99 family protein [Polyangiaceae bacterium]